MATDSLAWIGGKETYTLTVADHLQRLGHDVHLYARELGRCADRARDLGLRVVSERAELPGATDAILSQDGPSAAEMGAAYPRTPQAFVMHSDTWDAYQPPNVEGLIQVVIALYDRVELRVRALPLDVEVVRLSQPVDHSRFKPLRPLPERPRVALALGNYLYGERRELLREACARAGLELKEAGRFSTGLVDRPELLLNEADIVFGKGRVIHEAMACGCAAYVLDRHGAEGWVTAESYPRLAAGGFGGTTNPAPVDVDSLAADLGRYDRGMGLVNRDLIVANHAAQEHAARLVEVLARLAPRAPVDAPLDEIARLTRLRNRTETQVWTLQSELELLNRRVQEVEAALERAQANERAAWQEAVRAQENEKAAWREAVRAQEAEAASRARAGG